MADTSLKRSDPAYRGIASSQSLAAETAQLAQNLPERAAIRVAARVTREEEHLADLLFRVCLARTVKIVTVL